MSAILARMRAIPAGKYMAVVAIAIAVAIPLWFDSGSPFVDDCVLALAYIAMALGLNIIVGFAGLLDLGYVAFFAIGAYTIGYLGSNFLSGADGGAGVHLLVGSPTSELPGVHMNFLVILVCAVAATSIAGMLIGLPTLRLRGDYIAIVTLAFGEIIGRIAINGDQVRTGGIWDNTIAKLPVIPEIGDSATLTNGRQGITPVDKIDLPFLERFPALDLRPWYFAALALVLLVVFVSIRLRDSRQGRAWIAIREDEVAASSMGIPLVRTKLLAYGTGAAFGGMAGAFLGSYLNTVNADQFQFSFSIFVLAMVILGGLGSVWGVVVGAVTLSLINNLLIPDVLNNVPSDIGLDFDLTQLSFGIFGFLLVIVVVLRPEGLIPEKRRKLELHGVGAGATTGVGGPPDVEPDLIGGEDSKS
ncbi:MAG: branched-chain amino acid ABC transporter permease [Actinomycetota bacterium]|nr:branched-chain amino acid ABC transporter permease [Actinomycetota bacterium]